MSTVDIMVERTGITADHGGRPGVGAVGIAGTGGRRCPAMSNGPASGLSYLVLGADLGQEHRSIGADRRAGGSQASSTDVG